MRKLDFDLKLKLNDKRLYPTKSVKYLGINLNESFTLNEHINGIATKLSGANAVLIKVREFMNIRVLKPTYHAIFDCYLNYTNLVWCQNKNSVNRLFVLQKKALIIIIFECRNAHSDSLFCQLEIVELHDKIIIENCLFISKSINFDLSSIFNYCFIFFSDLIATKYLVLQKDS